MSMPRRRWPPRVYDEGEEPDPRFSLANERTFLAWIRTTLALLAAAAAVDALDLSIPEWLSTVVAIVLAVIGMVCAVQAWRGWARTEAALRQREPLPSNPANIIVAVGVGSAALALVVSALVGGS